MAAPPAVGGSAAAGGRRLFDLHEIAHLPHTRKNKHILSGYRVHTGLADAMSDLLTVSNETANIATSLTGLLVAIYMWYEAALHRFDLLPEYWWLVVGFGAGCAVNSLLVTAYHATLAWPSVYHWASALDLAAIAVAGLPFSAAVIFVPGMSAVAGSLRQLPASSGNAALTALYGSFAAYLLIVGTLVTVRRIVVRHAESPPVLLFLNVLPHLCLVLDHAVACPTRWSHVSIICMVGGALLYSNKLPERLLSGLSSTSPSPCTAAGKEMFPLAVKAHERRSSATPATRRGRRGSVSISRRRSRTRSRSTDWKGTAVTIPGETRKESIGGTGSSAPTSSSSDSKATGLAADGFVTAWILLPHAAARLKWPHCNSSARLIDIVGHSHMLWHILYTLAWVVSGTDIVHLALAASSQQQAHQSAA